MFRSIQSFLQRHPAVRDALLWSIPALLFGAFLRLLLLSYSPFAYWGADSSSYYRFSYRLLEFGSISLEEKRRYLYPIFMVPISLLPGTVLQWVAWLQHGLGLLTLCAFGYIIRKYFIYWRWWIVPLTVLYAGMPALFWYEHELLGESLFFVMVVWAFAGWAAWDREKNTARAAKLWWAFFVPLAMLMLIKPAGRFFWPGLLLALLLSRSWRVMGRWHVAALVTLIAASFTTGRSSQGAWLLYNSAFPLTRLDTPLHAEYKKEIADLVTEARSKLDVYYRGDSSGGIKRFLKNPDSRGNRPLWIELAGDEAKRTRIYKDLAREGILGRPDLFLYIAFQRIVDSSNPEEFKEKRFDADYFARRLEESYPKIAPHPNLASRLFGFPRDVPAPPLEEVQRLVMPDPESPRAAQIMQSYVGFFNDWFALTFRPEGKKSQAVTTFQITLLGYWMLAGGIIAILAPRFRANVGAWYLVAIGYLFGVFLVGSANPRFFCPAWAPLVLLLAVPLDWAVALVRSRISGKKEPAGNCAVDPAADAVR